MQQFLGKLFYVRKNDTILLPLIENYIYLKVLFPTEMETQKVDNFDNIIGGIGLSNLTKNKRSDYQLRNCILFGCKQSQMVDLMKKSYFVILYNTQAWKNCQRNKTECM